MNLGVLLLALSIWLSFLLCFWLCFWLFYPSIAVADDAIEAPYRGQRGLSQLFFSVPASPFLRSGKEPFDPEWYWSQHRIRTWGRFFGNWSQLDGQGSGSELHYSSFGGSIGIEQQIGNNFLHGLSFGGSGTSTSKAVKTNVSAFFGTAYCRTILRMIYLDAEIGIGQTDQTLPSNAVHNALQWNVNAEAGTRLKHGLGGIEPFIGIRYTSLDAKPSTESKTTLLGGVRYSWKTTGKLAVIEPKVYGGVIQELGGQTLLNAASIFDSPTVFLIPSSEIAATRLFFGGGWTASMGKSLDLLFRYTVETSSSSSSHSILAGMNWNF